MTAAPGDRDGAAAPDPLDLLGHDIRAAVSDVIGGLRLIDGDPLPEDVRGQLARIQASSELLARLVEELLSGGGNEGEDEVGNLNLPRFLDEELRRWHGAAMPLATRVSLDRSADLPEVVRLSRLSLRRVVANLMGNALRHAPGGTITLSADVLADGTLSIGVGDQGPGFPDAMLEGAVGTTRGTGPTAGSGMGLQIARARAEALGGTLVMRNRPGGGAEVTVRLPSGIWQREEVSETGLPDLTGHRILVAEDSVTSQTLVRAMLTRMGAECEVAADGIEALNWLSRERFDLALIDIEMPALGGIDVIRSERLRQARGIAPPTAMVAMTAYDLRDNRDAILEAGADGVLPKPLPEIAPFGRSVAHYLRSTPAAADWRPEAAPALSVATLAELMMAAGPEFQTDLLDGLRADLADVEAGLAGAIAAGNMAEIRIRTHILLSLAGAVGALPTQQAARRLNDLAREGDAEAVAIAGRLCLGRLADLREELAGAV
ncbi:ATP-binding protein [uncultured Jannaschia sp.]|uniref:ATP-binding protein n=1 Tax=uncultured Jannaschia sp. TaxID=293347 RepID=UPI00260222D6|nr:ATP-binding protein [uncultured Jannaschia sp.]